ncbi:hypothetical protein BS78_05G077000 [Paspalum vaginatum]|nr:hypothetical protein BS78_05G077000 [Paspalum vaginatum]
MAATTPDQYKNIKSAIDGGNYERALELIKTVQKDDLKNLHQKINKDMLARRIEKNKCQCQEKKKQLEYEVKKMKELLADKVFKSPELVPSSIARKLL